MIPSELTWKYIAGLGLSLAHLGTASIWEFFVNSRTINDDQQNMALPAMLMAAKNAQISGHEASWKSRQIYSNSTSFLYYKFPLINCNHQKA